MGFEITCQKSTTDYQTVTKYTERKPYRYKGFEITRWSYSNWPPQLMTTDSSTARAGRWSAVRIFIEHRDGSVLIPQTLVSVFLGPQSAPLISGP